MRKTLIALAALAWTAQAGAQTVNRCVDAAGHIYYYGTQPPAGVNCVDRSRREMPSAPPEPSPALAPGPTTVGPVPPTAREPRKRMWDPDALRLEIRNAGSFSLAECLANDTTWGGRFVPQSQQKRAKECAEEERRLKNQAEDARQWLRQQGDRE